MHLLPLSHPGWARIFIVFYTQADIHPGRQGWEAVCQRTPGFGMCREHPWTYSATQKQSWDKVIVMLVQSCEKPDGLISLHVLLYSLIKSKAWHRGVLLLKETGSERGWKHSRGSDQVINHPFPTWPLVPLQSPLDWASRSCQKTTWPEQLLSSQPSKCRGRQGEKQRLQPLFLVKRRTKFRFDYGLDYYPRFNWLGAFSWLLNSTSGTVCPELCWGKEGCFPEGQSAVGLSVQTQARSWLCKVICCRDQSRLLIQEVIIRGVT